MEMKVGRHIHNLAWEWCCGRLHDVFSGSPLQEFRHDKSLGLSVQPQIEPCHVRGNAFLTKTFAGVLHGTLCELA